MNTMTVARRLVLAFGVVIAVFLTVSGIALYSTTRLAEADKWNQHTYKVMNTADNMLQSMINMETGARGFLLAGEDHFLEPWDNGIQSFDKEWAEAKHLTSDNAAQQKRLDEIKTKNAEFIAVVKSMIQFRRDVTEGKKPMDEFLADFKQGKDKSAMDGFRSLDAGFKKVESSLLVERSATADSLRTVNRTVIIVGSLLAIVIAAGLGFWVTRSILGQLGGEPGYAASVAREIANGNLAVDVHVRAGDTSSLLAGMKNMRESLAQVVGRVRQGAESAATASEQIAQGNNDLSARTESQASALQQTAASMEQLNSTVRQNADNARAANQLAQSASTVATQGGEVVADVVRTMKEINESSSRIADIIGVIDSIAFQTNILALNAAVEAARAGEQGRGFAVVASEVRSLAGRSAEAAREIKSLIGASVERVETGTALVDRAGQTMAEVVGAIQRVTDIMGEISAASTEQSQGVAQVGEAVTQMDQVTQQNAALVEEMAAAAASLNTQAQDLVDTVAVFKLGGAMATYGTAARRPAAASSPKPLATLASPARPSPSKPAAVNKPAVVPKLRAPAAGKPAPVTGTDSGGEWESF